MRPGVSGDLCAGRRGHNSQGSDAAGNHIILRFFGPAHRSHYRWRAEYGGLKLDQVRRLKERERERENARLRKAVSDLTLEKVILKEAASGKF
jgi:hypothetical protein